MSEDRHRPPSRPSDITRENRTFEERSRAVEEQIQTALERNRAARERLQLSQERVRRRVAETRIVRAILDEHRSATHVTPTGEVPGVIDRNRQHESLPTSALRNSSMSDPAREIQRRFSREPQDRSSETLTTLPSFSSVSSAAGLPPLRSLGSRRGSSLSTPGGRSSRRPSERYLERYRASEARASNPTFEDLEYNLDHANSQLRALLDFTSNPIMPPQASDSPYSPPQDPTDDNRRVKRRKLDSDRLGSNYKGFRYGRYGQVEPGQLKMEIASCDGGQFFSPAETYAAENILKDDISVYCTKGNRCNIVLRHQGSTVFSLKELVIKAPGPSFSSPVREGLLFISMEQSEIFNRTAQYQIEYVRGHENANAERENRAPAHILSIRHNEDGSIATRAQLRQRRLLDHEEEEYRTARIPSEFTVAPPPFRVTTATECSDDDNEEAPFRPRRQAPNRIGALPFESDSSEEGGAFGHGYSSFEDIAPPTTSQRPESDTLAEAAEASQLATQEAVRAVGGGLLAPHARFFIEKDKNRCTIRFDPPVSGRFILLKMWNPHHDPSRNIDIQGVVAKGFAGPRYFPSVELR